LQIKTKIVSCHTADSKPVKQEVKGRVVLSHLVFPDQPHLKGQNPDQVFDFTSGCVRIIQSSLLEVEKLGPNNFQGLSN
jgi:hypothetical protein